MPNRLQHEQSPYLLQHQHNPVNWYPWGEEAFAAARERDVPLFLSIGYATCHWCHVMERESFEDEAVAAALNEHFVCVKVDREERPDIDQVYMTVCQMMGRSCGWPLTVLMTADQRPFFVATYLPPQARHGRMGVTELAHRVGRLWREDRDAVLSTAGDITRTLQQAAAHAWDEAEVGDDASRLAFEQLRQRFDPVHGGFGEAPKFPSPHQLVFLLRHAHRTGAGDARHMAETTLRAMHRGGFFDHLGGGFHRYSTDREWRLPHFEKMLYDQALHVLAYVEAYQCTGDAAYRAVAEDVLGYVERDLQAPEGGFFSAEDADSEGREGAFYVWTLDDVADVLGPDEAALFADAYGLTRDGNFEDEATGRRTGENVLHRSATAADLAKRHGTDAGAVERRLRASRRKLAQRRAERPRPGLDDKVLTDWNGLMIAAFARAAVAFGDDHYADVARRAADFVLARLRTTDGGLLHRYRAGHAGIVGHLDDFAFLIWGLLDLYEAGFDVRHLKAALDLQGQVDARFWDEDRGGCFQTDASGERLIVRQKELYDGALPSGASATLLNLARLSRMTGRHAFGERARALLRSVGEPVRQAPSAFTGLLLGFQLLSGPGREVVLVGEPGSEAFDALLAAVRASYAPFAVVLAKTPAAAEELAEAAPFTAGQGALEGRPTVYVCREFACQAPTSDPAAVRAALADERGER